MRFLTLIVLAVHIPSLGRMQDQPQLPHSLSNRLAQAFRRAVNPGFLALLIRWAPIKFELMTPACDSGVNTKLPIGRLDLLLNGIVATMQDTK